MFYNVAGDEIADLGDEIGGALRQLKVETAVELGGVMECVSQNAAPIAASAAAATQKGLGQMQKDLLEPAAHNASQMLRQHIGAPIATATGAEPSNHQLGLFNAAVMHQALNLTADVCAAPAVTVASQHAVKAKVCCTPVVGLSAAAVPGATGTTDGNCDRVFL